VLSECVEEIIQMKVDKKLIEKSVLEEDEFNTITP
jgi:hypothetical protein